MTDLTGKTVVVTGGSSGFGFTTAEALVAAGAQVVITGRTKETLDGAVNKLGDGASAIRSDAAVLSDIDDLAQQLEARYGTIDSLFVNAGITRFGRFEATDEQTYEDLFTVNAKGPYFTVQKLSPLIVDGGSIVLTTSVANVKGLPMVSAYAASKAALRSMTRSMARELLPRNIRVNAVSPGPIDTGILNKVMPAEQADAAIAGMIDVNPMKRLGTPDEIARAVVFLAFDATYTTGAELVVDGGATTL